MPRLLICLAVLLLQIPLASQAPSLPSDEWNVQLARGKTRTIEFATEEGTWMTVDVAPDGQTLVFDLLGEIYVLPIAGGQARLITRDSGVAVNFQPSISPDGRRIAFISDRAGQNNLWVMDADGGNPRAIEQNLKVRHSVPAWTPDSNFIIARRVPLGDNPAERRPELWLYHREGGKGVALTKGAEQNAASEPSVSRDGRHLYFSVESNGVTDPARGRTQLRRLDLHSGDVLNVTDGSERGPGGDARLSSGGGFTPRISPNGSTLAFGRRLASGTISWKGHQLGPRTALWVRNLGDGSERLLLDPAERDLQEDTSDWTGALPGYAWDPSGRSVFVGQGGKIRRVDAANGRIDTIPFTVNVRRTISEMAYRPFRIADRDPMKVRFIRWPALSPDGKRVAFQAVGRVWIMDLPGGAPRRLTPSSFPYHEYAPAWSPDGQSLAFASWSDDEHGHLYKIAAGGGEPRQLTRAAAEYQNPAWTPDGSGIVVVRSSGATLRGQMLAENTYYDLCLVPAGGGEPRLVVSVGPPSGRVSHRRAIVHPSFGPDGRLFYPEMVTRDGDTKTELRSIRLDGNDRKTHLTLPFADQVVVSADGQWLAFEEGDNVYVAPLPPHGIGGKALELKREDKPVWNIRPVTREGGNFPRWSGGGRLAVGSADELFVFDAASGKTDRHRISLQVPRDLAAGAVALTGARIITMEEAGVIERGDIVIADGRISAVGASGSIAIPGGATRIDARGKTIMPGLVDLHTHNHRSPSGIMPQRDYEMGAVLAYGVTTTLDNSMWSQNIFPQSEMVEAGEVVGPRVYSTGDPLYAGDHARQNELKSLEQTRQEVRRLKSYGAVSLKQYQQPERRQRQWVSEAARGEGLMVTAEGGDMLYILTMVMDGQTGWEHPIPQVPVYDDLAQFLGRAGVHYSPTLVVAGPGPWNDQYWIQQSELWSDPKLRRFSPWRKLEAHTRRRDLRPSTDYTFPFLAQGVADIIKAGGYGAIGAHGQQHGIASQWEVWMLASAMPALDALRVATQHGAMMIGVQEDLGSLKSGKLADLVVLNGNPLEDIRQTANIQYVMKGGRLYNGDNLDEIWPRKRRYGKFFWEMDAARPTDVKTIK
jgi:Tol biopolymer transport system component/imidazolonepropionase-like amidohydrolase